MHGAAHSHTAQLHGGVQHICPGAVLGPVQGRHAGIKVSLQKGTPCTTGGQIMQAGCPKAESELLKDSMAMNCRES